MTISNEQDQAIPWIIGYLLGYGWAIYLTPNQDRFTVACLGTFAWPLILAVELLVRYRDRDINI